MELESVEDEIKIFARRCKNSLSFTNLIFFFVFTCVSLAFYVLDIGLDLFWLYKFLAQEYYWYFGFTLLIWSVSIVTITSISVSLYNKRKMHDPRHIFHDMESNFSLAMKWIFCAYPLIPRYFDAITYAYKAMQAKKKDGGDMYFVAMIWEEAELIKLCQVECFLEQAPQLCLTVYRLMIGESQLDASLLFSIFSVMGLAWALVTYDRKICEMNGIIDRNQENLETRSAVIINFQTNDAIDCIKNMNWKRTTQQFFFEFFWIVGRIIGFGFFAAEFPRFICGVCLVYFGVMFHWHYLEKNYSFADSLSLSLVHVFAYLYPAEKASDKERHPRMSPGTFKNTRFCENMVFMIIWTKRFTICDERPNIGSILSYPTFYVPVVIECFTIISNYFLFWLLNKAH